MYARYARSWGMRITLSPRLLRLVLSVLALLTVVGSALLSGAELPGAGNAPIGASALSHKATPTPACRPSGPLPAALAGCRNWIAFSPPRPFDPRHTVYPSVPQLRRWIAQLIDEGWRGLVTYSLDGTLAEIPKLAHEAGFSEVVAGLFWYDDEQLRRERVAAVRERRDIDAYVVGNEGLIGGRYTLAELHREIARLRVQTGKPVTTTEPAEMYRKVPALARSIGDWAFPIIHPWWAAQRRPVAAARWVNREYCSLRALARGRMWVVKEAWWPSAGADPAATAANQWRFLDAFMQTAVPAIQGEAYDQSWRAAPGGVGRFWGWHRADASPRPVVARLRRLRGPTATVTDPQRACRRRHAAGRIRARGPA